jgi:putative lipase involved disintegration of autophagic bodies
MSNGFRASIFQRGDKIVVAFAGTDPASFTDLTNDVQQARGLLSAQYEAAVLLANKISPQIGSGNLEFTGHSLGGGLAAVASGVTGRSSITFNAAPISSGTLQRYAISGRNLANISNYYVRGDPATGSSIFPNQQSAGTQIAIGSAVRYLGSGLID